jgi:hypothetical protein
MMKRILQATMIVAIGLLSAGTVVKKKGAIELTQTDPVSYQEKAKEQVEGKKGSPSPAIRLYPKELFLTQGPLEKEKVGREGEEDERSELEEEEEVKPDLETDDSWQEWPEEKPPSRPLS